MIYLKKGTFPIAFNNIFLSFKSFFDFLINPLKSHKNFSDQTYDLLDLKHDCYEWNTSTLKKNSYLNFVCLFFFGGGDLNLI